MAEQFLGYTVTISCRDEIGSYQGQICGVDPKEQTICLRKAFKNGIPVESQLVSLKGADIMNLSIIESPADNQTTSPSSSTVAVKKPVPKRAGRSVSESLATNKGTQLRDSPRKPTEDIGIRIPYAPVMAVYDEINAQKPDIVRHADPSRRSQKYRHDENVIASAPAMYRQVIVPAPGLKEYVTELPTIAVDLIVLALADELGNQVHQPRYRVVADWANENRAPVLALDPPAAGTPYVETKFSLVPGLPLAHSSENGKLYLCNLAFPQQVFKEIGVKYNSPFGPKFVIPLHPNDS
ncbi:hypothetical protein C0J52_00448 [Blattella germanica]|nr:hypothetical protein C0J52_00448 [Blattella germanica]